MTHEKYEELHFLKTLLDRTDSVNKWYLEEDLILATRTARMTADRAEEIFHLLRKGQYIDEIENHADSNKSFYIISDAGRWYYSHLLIEEQKDALDLKLKDISIRNIKTTRIIAWASLIISLAVGGVQVLRYIEEKLAIKKLSPDEQTILIDDTLLSKTELDKLDSSDIFSFSKWEPEQAPPLYQKWNKKTLIVVKTKKMERQLQKERFELLNQILDSANKGEDILIVQDGIIVPSQLQQQLKKLSPDNLSNARTMAFDESQKLYGSIARPITLVINLYDNKRKY